MATKYEEQMYNDIHRIANALEKIAKSLESIEKLNFHQNAGIKIAPAVIKDNAGNWQRNE